MKSSIIALVAMLVCLVVASTALAECPPGVGNCIDVYDGGDGEIIGDDNFVTENSLDDLYNDGIKATLTNGVDAQIKIPAGSQGIVKLAFDREGYQSTNPTLNGEQYLLQTAFNGMIKLGAEKTSTEGVEIASAKIFSKAAVDNGFVNPDTCPTCKKNLLSGEATINAYTKSTGTGGTYAIVKDAAASYRAVHNCPTCPNVNKEVSGEVSVRKVALQTCNAECPDCCTYCEPKAPSGTKIGNALITTYSNANNYVSNSASDIKLDVSATRGKSGRSAITGDIYYASAASRARDGSAPLGSTKWNAQSLVRADDLDASAYAFAANDNAKASGLLHSEAMNNQDTNANKAYNKAEVYQAVVRSDLNTPGTYAKAAVDFDNAYFAADGRNLKTSNKYAFERATIADLNAAGQLGKVSNIWSRATLQLTAKRNGANSNALITNDVANYGPKTGYATDFSEAHELANNLRAEAKSPSETRFVNIVSKDVDSKITGTTGTPSAPANQAIISGITTSANGATTAVAYTQTQKVGVNNIWKLVFLEKND